MAAARLDSRALATAAPQPQPARASPDRALTVSLGAPWRPLAPPC
ncbi:hypothetical protein SAMN06265784_104350 [Paraburkholderia susongensis]|uniref:Uncharacterized protein n=1 Tax=Paraburkholderia susongensis TaxID=1515439 RepID=A0A1X7KUH8_9BURK|nr:hypothetical protein SAMN06265784_104350 [Paraburkholderia susongensis]